MVCRLTKLQRYSLNFYGFFLFLASSWDLFSFHANFLELVLEKVLWFPSVALH